jgi:hypothetical protein
MIVNLTSHVVNVADRNGKIVSFYRAEADVGYILASVDTHTNILHSVEREGAYGNRVFDVRKTVFGEPFIQIVREDGTVHRTTTVQALLNSYPQNTVFIVSEKVLRATKGLPGFWVTPNVEQPVCDRYGRVLGVLGFRV